MSKCESGKLSLPVVGFGFGATASCVVTIVASSKIEGPKLHEATLTVSAVVVASIVSGTCD